MPLGINLVCVCESQMDGMAPAADEKRGDFYGTVQLLQKATLVHNNRRRWWCLGFTTEGYRKQLISRQP